MRQRPINGQTLGRA